MIAQPVARSGETWQYTPQLPDGRYQAQVQATDMAGNTSATEPLYFEIRTNTAITPHKLHLPMVANQRRPPDNRANLLIEALSVQQVNGRVEVTLRLRNAGDQPAGGFWVDLYVDPSRPPVAGASWNSLCDPPWPNSRCYGGAWQVTRTLAPGERATLSSTDLTADREYSHWTATLPAGKHVLYAVVDSDGSATGQIAEADETDNVSQPVPIVVTDQ